MNALTAIWGTVRRFGRAVVNRFEAVFQRWGERSILGQSLQSSWLDIDSATRKELQRRHRYWVANSAILSKIRNLKLQFAVGVSGLQVTPNASGDDDGSAEEWNHFRQHTWQAWGRNPERSSNITIGQLTAVWEGALFDDGEIFIHKVMYKGRPYTETIEAHRIDTPMDLRSEENKTIIDGIAIDPTHKPTGYWVRRPDRPIDPTPSSQEFDLIPAEEMIHVFKCRRPGQMRGIPEASALNLLHDFQDLQKLEMDCARLAAEIGVVETTPTGEIDTRATRRTMLSTGSVNANNGIVTKSMDQFYNVVMGGRRIGMKVGDSIKSFQVDRPTVVQQEYWNLIIGQICAGYNVPKLLVFPYSVQGTVARADLDICTNAFRVDFELIAWALQQVYEWQTQWAVDFDRSMLEAPPLPDDYLSCIIRPPVAANVDIGYTAQALQLELQMGTKTIQDVYAERQQDWRHQLTQVAETEAFIDKLAQKYNLDPNRISQKAKQPTAAKPEEEPKEEPTE